MTKGSLQGIHGNSVGSSQINWLSARREMSKWALRLAVFAALQPGFARAAEEVWPETSIQPTARPVQAAAPLAPDAEEPMPPGEGPVESVPTNEIDTVTIGGGNGVDNFWKPEIHAGVTASVVFDDNVFITNTNAVSDTVFVTSARMTFSFGNVQQWAARFIDTTSRALEADEEQGADNLIALSYAPTASFFSDNSDLDSVDHDVAGTVRWNFGKLALAFDGRFQTLSDPDEDLGRRADRAVTGSHLIATYNWSEKLRLQLDGKLLDRNYEVGNDSLQIEGNAYMLYDVLPKTTLGFGFGGGKLMYDRGGSETFERLTLRARYNSYSKLTFSLSGGVEFRQRDFDEDQVNGIFQMGIGYSPTDTSELFFSAYQRIEPSGNGIAQSVEKIGFSLRYNQQIFQKLTLGSILSYSVGDYIAPATSLNTDRSDNLFSLSTTLTFEVTANGFVRLGYVYRQNDSSRNNVSYENNQFLLSATVLF